MGNLSLGDRLKHFTFAWYAMTMSTGGAAFVLSVIPNRIDGLIGLGTGTFILNHFLFTCVTITIITRSILYPGTLTHSLTNPHEGFFFATFWLSIARVIANTAAYGIPNSDRGSAPLFDSLSGLTMSAQLSSQSSITIFSSPSRSSFLQMCFPAGFSRLSCYAHRDARLCNC
jgi:hypothetical protein